MLRKILLFAIVLIITGMIHSDSVSGYESPEMETSAKSFVLMEAGTRQVVTGKNENVRVPSGALNKLMTALIAAESMNDGFFTMDTELTASENAHTAGGAVIWLDAGEKITAEELMKGLLIGNANDAAVVFAEKISGNCEKFTELMNKRAAELGMYDTVFVSPYATDDENQYTTAADAARLTSEISEHTELRGIMTTWLDYIRDGRTEVANENALVKKYNGITGVKAWHTELSGWCLAASAERNGLSYVSVVMGCDDKDNRFAAGKKLLNTGFSIYKTVVPGFFPEHMKPIKVKDGADDSVLIEADKVIPLVIPRDAESRMSTVVFEPEYIEAPVREGQKIGTVGFYLDKTLLYETPLITSGQVSRNSFRKSFMKIIVKMFK